MDGVVEGRDGVHIGPEFHPDRALFLPVWVEITKGGHPFFLKRFRDVTGAIFTALEDVKDPHESCGGSLEDGLD